jgi:hypothetical protein
MAVTPVVFGDATAAAVTALREALGGRAEPAVQGVTVGRRVPAGRSPDAPGLPYVQVAKDSDTPHPSMGNTRCTLRVTAWHKDADKAHDLAQLCQALLVVHRGPVLRSVRPGTGPLDATDPDSGTDLSSITVLANVRPQALA